jgi:hypothetical protein
MTLDTLCTIGVCGLVFMVSAPASAVYNDGSFLTSLPSVHCNILGCGQFNAHLRILFHSFTGNLNAVAMSREYWPLVVVTILTGTNTFMVQFFFLHRYWRM